MHSDDAMPRRERGVQAIGRAHGELGQTLIQRLRAVAPDLADRIVTDAYGGVLSRPELSVGDRERLTVAMLIALGDSETVLRAHIEAACKNGVTEAELHEIILLASVYCGYPRAVSAALICAEVVAGR